VFGLLGVLRAAGHLLRVARVAAVSRVVSALARGLWWLQRRCGRVVSISRPHSVSALAASELQVYRRRQWGGGWLSPNCSVNRTLTRCAGCAGYLKR